MILRTSNFQWVTFQQYSNDTKNFFFEDFIDINIFCDWKGENQARFPYPELFEFEFSHLCLIGWKSNSSIGLKLGMEESWVLLHLNGGKLSWVGPATAVNSKEGNDAALATLASNAP